ncbi:hypothetical protein E2C01_094450 [Portunus trituberculatus]|uniref:Uncharacterized protein n=1 Tax=Portunus trituberculatus TaxID=210409 RepID=A0A5B7JWW4_PORTR|nr:hypothetical protein [Portunus trituberculatus]
MERLLFEKGERPVCHESNQRVIIVLLHIWRTTAPLAPLPTSVVQHKATNEWREITRGGPFDRARLVREDGWQTSLISFRNDGSKGTIRTDQCSCMAWLAGPRDVPVCRVCPLSCRDNRDATYY